MDHPSWRHLRASVLPDVRHIRRNVELGPWIKVTLGSRHWRAETLVLQPVREEDVVEGKFRENQVERGWVFFYLKNGPCIKMSSTPACCAPVYSHPRGPHHRCVHTHTLHWLIGRHSKCMQTIQRSLPIHSPPHQSVLEPEAPPLLVVVLLGDASVEDPPAPLVDEVAERDEGDLVEGHLH